jgi:penicillin-binding protein-related factor A (putative recombinase)
LTFWRKDFETSGVKQSFQIRKCQILGLQRWSEHKGVFGFIFNFRNNDNQTFFVDIKDFIKYTSTLSKKSVNISDIEKMNPIKIHSRLLRTNYRYDIETFLQETVSN